MITDDRMQEAIDFLASTDEEAATLRTEAERAEFKARAVKDTCFKFAEGTVADRTASAGIAEEYKQAMAVYFEALQAAETIRNRRQTAELVVRAWQTVSSNRRQGGM